MEYDSILSFSFLGVALEAPQLSYTTMRFLQFATAFAAVASAAAIPAKQRRSTEASTKLEFFGINESGAEFGTAIPGTYNKVTLLLRRSKASRLTIERITHGTLSPPMTPGLARVQTCSESIS